MFTIRPVILIEGEEENTFKLYESSRLYTNPYCLFVHFKFQELYCNYTHPWLNV